MKMRKIKNRAVGRERDGENIYREKYNICIYIYIYIYIEREREKE